MTTEPAGELTGRQMVELMVGRDVGGLYPERRPLPDPGQHAALTVSNLSDPPQLVGFDVRTEPGEIVGLYGLEGHGQDTVLAALAGDGQPVSGEVTVAGQRVKLGDPAVMAAAGFGYVPEDRSDEGLVTDFPGWANVVMPALRRLARAGVTSPRRARHLAAEAARRAGVVGDLSAPAGALSGGNQQKLVLARWLAGATSVLLLNQPTRGVDVGSKAEIYELIQGLCRDEGRTALVVSREIPELLGFCDRILVFYRGRVAGEVTAAHAEEREVLRLAVGGDDSGGGTEAGGSGGERGESGAGAADAPAGSADEAAPSTGEPGPVATGEARR